MVKSIALSGLLIILAGLIAFQYYITSVPGLENPISATDARFVDNDNSLLVSLVGAEGQRFTLGLRGDIIEKPEETALFFISHPDLVPYVYWPGLRSNDEKRVMALLGRWVQNLDKPAAVELRSVPEVTKRAEPTPNTTAYHIYSVLKSRN